MRRRALRAWRFAIPGDNAMQDYYAARAAEYDRIYAKPER